MNCLEKKCRKPSRLSTPMMAQALELPCLLPHIHCIFKLRIAENWQIIFGLPFGFSRNLWYQTFHSFQAQLFIFFSLFFYLEECYRQYFTYTLQNVVQVDWICKKSKTWRWPVFSDSTCTSTCSFLLMFTNSFGDNNKLVNSSSAFVHAVAHDFTGAGCCLVKI